MNEPKRFTRLNAWIAFSCILAVICGPSILEAQQNEKLLAGTPEGAREIVDQATALIKDMVSEPGSFPPEILREAAGIAVVPNLIKAGFVPGGRHGSGVLLANENSEWSPPIFLSITGGNIGAQIGITSTDLVFVFTDPGTIERLKEGGSLALGIDATMEAGPAGPIGESLRDTEIYAYSRSEGPFEGASLTGSTLAFDRDTTLAFYEEGIEEPARAFYGKERRLADDLLSIDKRAQFKIPQAAQEIREVLKNFASNRSGESK